METGNWAQWSAVGLTLFNLVVTAVLALSRGQKAEIKAIAEGVAIAGERIERLDDRLVRCEAEIEHLPDRDTTHRLEMAIARLEGRMETMDERLKPIAAIAVRFQDMAMEGKIG